MKITNITTYFLPGDPRPEAWCPRQPHVFVRVETTSGIAGWGEAYTLRGREKSLVELIGAMAEQLIGTDVSAIKGFNHWVYNRFGEQRVGIDVFCASSGIEIALWDALGRSLDMPVYQLIGGTCHDTLPAYANFWSPQRKTADQLAAKAMECLEAGFTMLKFYPFQASENVAEGIEKLRVMREAIGPDIKLAADLWRHASPDQARELCRLMEPFDLFWVEDAIPPNNPAVIRRLRGQVRQPLITGETLATKRQFAPLFDIQATGMVNPDVCACGGILELREIAAMAEPKQILISPHNFNSMALGLAATIHAAAGIPNLLPVEFFPEFAEDVDEVCSGGLLPEEGQFAMPAQPGLGIEFDMEKMERYRISD